MTGRLAIGVGCRRDCPGEAIAALAQAALARARGEPMALFTLEDKRGQAGPLEAARLLGLELRYLSRAQLAAVSKGVVTPSAQAQNMFGVAAVAEAAALAGAGPGARLVVARIAGGGATCALAEAS